MRVGDDLTKQRGGKAGAEREERGPSQCGTVGTGPDLVLLEPTSPDQRSVNADCKSPPPRRRIKEKQKKEEVRE